MKILVVDDDNVFLKMVEDILSQAGHEVILAADGPEAFEKATAETPDLIVLDIILPSLLGDEVCRKLRDQAATASIPVLLVSSRFASMEEEEGLLEQFKGDDFLHKPFKPEALLEKVNRLAGSTSRFAKQD
jgi:DNA-binding response OmpR family regulator